MKTYLAAVLHCSLVALQAGPLTFTEVTSQAGITHRHAVPDVGPFGFYPPAGWMPGGGVAEDFNGDGLIDLYALQGGLTPNLLYINCGNGRFKEEGAQRGAALRHVGMGASAADFDNDGDIDICATSLVAPHYILQNDGNGYFSIRQTLPFPVNAVMSPSWGDINNDGQLELALARWQPDSDIGLYWNLGGGNLQPTAPIRGAYFFSPVFADINNDRRADLLLVADYSGTKFHINNGSGVFTAGESGTDENGMGTAIGDYDNDGDLDCFVTAIKDDNGAQGYWGVSGNRLYRNEGDGTFTDVTEIAGVRDGDWGWGAAFADFDLDGDLDLFHVNGWPQAALGMYAEFGETPARLFENMGDGTFEEVAAAAGVDDRGQGRGVAVFDLENDGDLDIFIINNQDSSEVDGSLQSDPGTPVLLRNDSSTSNHWLKVRLAGKPPLHSHGIGSRVYVTTGDTTQMRELNASTGFLAHGPNRIAHFGLGSAAVATKVTASWTNGDETQVMGVRTDREVVLPSPTAEVSKRKVLVGESLSAYADPSEYPDDAILVWNVGGASRPNPASGSFRSAGLKRIRLDVLDGVNPSQLLWSETLRVMVTEPPVDSDGDGMPDAWEVAHFLNANSPSNANVDNDNDRQTNLQEYLAGTNPNSSESVFTLTGVASENGMLLCWPSVLEKQYVLYRSDDLKAWEPHPDWMVPIPGTGTVNHLILPMDAERMSFRIGILEGRNPPAP